MNLVDAPADVEKIAVALAAAALFVSLWTPLVGYFVAAVALYWMAAYAPRAIALGILALAHAGGIIFASRDYGAASSDFPRYYELYQAICSANGQYLAAALWEFGPESGLPVFYLLLRVVGLTFLSINGLAYLQALITGTATLVVVAQVARERTRPRDVPIVVTGAGLMYSFFYSTQLSRQALAATFVLWAMYMTQSTGGKVLAVAVAGAFHVTAPLTYLFASLMRRGGLVALMFLGLAVAMALWSRELIALVFHVGLETAPGLSKVSFYASTDAAGVVFSDIQTVVYLLAGGLLVAYKRFKDGMDLGDDRILLGLALLALLMLPLPLAATRVCLLFASLAIGYYLFEGLCAASRTVGVVLLLLVGVYRLWTFASGGGEAHSLWAHYSAIGYAPGYFLAQYVRAP